MAAWWAFFLWATTVGTDGPPATQPGGPTDKPPPTVRCDQAVFDFGKVDNHTVVEHAFTLVNDGAAPTVVTSLHQPCGCTVAALPERPIPPGGKADLPVRLSLRGRKGPIHVTVQVRFNDPAQSTVTLTLKGTAVANLAAQPERVTFGQLDFAASAARSVTISADELPGPFRIEQVVCDSPAFEAKCETVTEGQSYRLEVRTRPPLPGPGNLTGNVIVTTDQERCRRINIPLYALVAGDLVVRPEAILLNRSSTEALTLYVMILPGRTRTFRLLEIRPPADDIQVNVFSLGNGFRIQLAGVRVSEQLEGKHLLIRTDAEAMKEIRIPWHLVGQAGNPPGQPPAARPD